MTEAEPLVLMKEQLALLNSVANSVPCMLAYWDQHQRCRFANAAYERWFGVTPEHLIGNTLEWLLGPLYLRNLPHIVAALRGERQEFEREIPDPAGGAPRFSQAHYLPDLASDGSVRGFVVFVADITARRQLELQLGAARERAEVRATHDPLTGLPNRLLLEDRIQRALETAKRVDGRCAVMFTDLDGFKAVNDTHGHAAGDAVLIEVARRLSGKLRASDTLARIGGDEFLVLLPDIGEPERVQVVAAKLLDAMSSTPFDIDGQALALTFSIGVALYPLDGANVRDLMAHADQALYQAKRAGKNICSFFRG